MTKDKHLTDKFVKDITDVMDSFYNDEIKDNMLTSAVNFIKDKKIRFVIQCILLNTYVML